MEDQILRNIKQKNAKLINTYQRWHSKNVDARQQLQLIDEPLQKPEEGDHNIGKRVSYRHLFTDKGQADSKLYKRILVIGEAGIGKTVLCTSIAQDWASDNLFQEFLCVFLLPLCRKGIASAHTLPNLLKELPYDFSEETCSFVATFLMKNKTQNILIIADGLNDLHESRCLTEQTLLHKLLFGDLISNVTILVTSRSTSMTA